MDDDEEENDKKMMWKERQAKPPDIFAPHAAKWTPEAPTPLFISWTLYISPPVWLYMNFISFSLKEIDTKTESKLLLSSLAFLYPFAYNDPTSNSTYRSL